MRYIRETDGFIEALAEVQDPKGPHYSARIAEATTAASELPHPLDPEYHSVRYYLAQDGQSGFGLVQRFERGPIELVGVFSTVPGRGDELVDMAISFGADILDCFDGYLPTLYARHGFTEYKRVQNWTPGEPDVVFMLREGADSSMA